MALMLLALSSSTYSQTQNYNDEVIKLLSDPPHTIGVAASADYDPALIVYTMTVSNPATVSRILSAIGVQSRARGSFMCLSGAYAATPIADYRIRFMVQKPVTEIKADPTLVIEPKGVAKFTISLIPDATGACGHWEATVSAFAKFDDGTVLSSGWENISSDDVQAAKTRKPKVWEVLDGLNSKLKTNQIIAIGMIAESGMGSEAARQIIERRLSDQDIRTAAAQQAVALHFSDLLPRLIEIYQEEKNAYYRSVSLAGLCEIFRDERCIDPLLREIVDFDGSFATEALIKLGKFAGADHARVIAEKLFGEPESKRRENILLELVYVLVAYRDPSSLTIVRKIIESDSSRYDDDFLLRNTLIRLSELITGRVSADGEYISNGAEGKAIRRDPFFGGLAPSVQKYRTDKDQHVKENATIFLDALAN
jgi:hypothetical protein